MKTNKNEVIETNLEKLEKIGKNDKKIAIKYKFWHKKFNSFLSVGTAKINFAKNPKNLFYSLKKSSKLKS